MINVGDYVLIKEYPDSQIVGRKAIITRTELGACYPYEVRVVGKEYLGVYLVSTNEIEKVYPINRRLTN